jgi:hypothetical protein
MTASPLATVTHDETLGSACASTLLSALATRRDVRALPEHRRVFYCAFS